MKSDLGGNGLRAQSETTTVLFVMRSLVYLRFFQSTLELLVERGLKVRLLLQNQHGTTVREPGHDRSDHATLWLERMRAKPNFTCDIVNHFADPHSRRASGLRRGVEYVRFRDPALKTWAYMYGKRRRGAPTTIQRLTDWPVIRTSRGRRILFRILTIVERAFPVPAQAVSYVEDLHPDLVAVCDSTSPGSLLSTYARAAKMQGIPVAECVASWDNLTSRQRLRVVPDQLVVWNEKQVTEAVRLHGIPSERVAVCGAPSFDKWFAWAPRDRDEFLTSVGLDPSKPVILWVGGALYPATRTEAEYAAAWIAALRASHDATLREAGVILRPHPYRNAEWGEIDVSDLGNAVVWPRDAGMPVAREQQADLYDSIFHSSAVLGLNTSVMIEAAIVGRPVLTILEPEFQSAQLDTFHFEYLLESSGGAVRATHSVEESLSELSAILDRGAAEASERAKLFVAQFVRPEGLEQPATPIVVDTLERLAEASVGRERDPVWAVVLRGFIVVLEPVFVLLHAFFSWVRRSIRRLSRASGRQVRRFWKQIRRFFLVWLRAGVRSRLQGR